MGNKPKGAMGSPYCNSEDGPSIADLMGDAFDRLHENSWDGGKKKKQVEKINAEIDKKIQKNSENFVDETIIKDADTIEKLVNGKVFTVDYKTDILQLLLKNNYNINEITDEKIVFTVNEEKFVILPL